MSLSQQEAAVHLQEAEVTGRRSARAFGYRKASPHLILWGVIWGIGYAGTDFYPNLSGRLWYGLIAIGALMAFYLSRAAGRAAEKTDWRQSVRLVGLIAAFLVFFLTTYAILGPLKPAQYAVFPAVLVGMVYFGMGLWIGMRMIVTGAAIFALSVGGYFLIHQHFSLWMAVVGGGALILGGIWLRRV
jgi:hypothetical protein